jgi:peptidoglycan/LPS O-acetylase OafA/YrhL
MVHHFAGVGATSLPMTPSLTKLIGIGWIGVEIFFVLSGFLITNILLSTGQNSSYYLNFYARRTLRIFPLHYFALALVILAASLLEPRTKDSEFLLQHQAWLWLYGTNLLSAFSGLHLSSTWFSVNHFWSLAIEEQFYCVWPAAVRAIPVRRIARYCLIVASISICVRIATSYFLGGKSAYLLTLGRLDNLMIGAALAAFYRTNANLENTARLTRFAVSPLYGEDSLTRTV